MAQSTRPNIVWIVLDDASSNMGAYGDRQARTPNMDRLAREGVRFTNAFTHAPVCAPSRSGLITGMYPTTTGAHHMRSQLINPPEVFTVYLRRAGYQVVWPGKTDFNFAVPTDTADPTRALTNDGPPGAFDSRQDWTEQAPAERPFFAYVNLGVTHESQVRLRHEAFAKVTARLKQEDRHDPARMIVPPYYPDAPEVRRDLANYYDLMTVADYRVGDILKRLDEQGLSDNTIVFLFADHGRGMPRAKRWLYDSGIRVPLVVRWPGRLEAGTVNDNLVSFVDFAPTVLSLAGAPVPTRFQGQVFLGEKARRREYVYAARDRMDETFDRIRAVRDKRFKYIRNFHPELPYAQLISYNELNPSMQAWRKLYEEGKLTGAAKLFFAATKPREELYDTTADPDEINNLADSPKYKAIVAKMRRVLDEWIVDTKDLGEVPEAELVRRGLVRDVLKDYANRQIR
jgi:uncharacterized sulfatase